MAYCCLMQCCKFEAQYVCLCLSYETYCCEFHFRAHLSLPYRSHSFHSILDEPCEWTKDEILKFLEKEKLKKEKLKNIAKSYSSQNFENTQNSIEEILEFDLEQINKLISQVSKVSEQNQISNPLNLQPDEGKLMLSEDSEPYKSVQLYFWLNQLRMKTDQILNKDKNDPEIEQEFRRTCWFYQNYVSDPQLSQALQGYINAYKKLTSLYLLDELIMRSNFFIYDTESETEEIKTLKPPGELQNSLNITPLPNGEFFYYGSTKNSSIPFIIDKNYKFRQLPNGCYYRHILAIYFNRSVYCFNGYDRQNNSCKFCRLDLDKNRWIQLALLWKNDPFMSSIIFNGNILVAGGDSFIFLYSVEIDSFSKIHLADSLWKRKLLINSKERVYVIDHMSIFESEVENVYVYKQIGKSIVQPDSSKVYCSYNKGGVYLAFLNIRNFRQYFKFDFDRKILVEVACYHKHIALRKLEGKLEAINSHGQILKLNPDHTSNFINKRYSLYYISNCLEKIENINEKIQKNPHEHNAYIDKGCNLQDLDRNLEAIDCYNKAIELDPKIQRAYTLKGHSLHDMGRNLEAIECYNQAIKLNHSIAAYIGKGLALHDLNRYYDAIECYNELINIDPQSGNANYNKGESLYALGKTTEALECYNKEINNNGTMAKYYIAKAKALCDLDRKLEAILCYNQIIKSDSEIFLYYCYRANILNDIGQEEEAVQDFNTAYNLMSTKSSFINHSKHAAFSDNFIDETVFQDFLDLIKNICQLEENAAKFKKEMQKLKDAKNEEILKEVEEKEALVKEMNSKILKKAIECLDSSKNVLIEAIQQVKQEVVEHQQRIKNMCIHLWSLLSTQ